MSLTIRGPRVVVETIAQDRHEHASGLVTVESYAPEVMGTIVAAGDVRDVQVGDTVLFPPSAGQVVEWEEGRFVVLREDELLAIWEDA